MAYDILTATGGGGTSDSTHVQSYTDSGDLGVAAYAPSPFAHDTTEIDLTPRAGYEVVLNSFDLVSYATELTRTSRCVFMTPIIICSPTSEDRRR